MPHCIHTTKRCQHGLSCGLHDVSGCSIISLSRAERIAPPMKFDYRGYFVPIVTEKLDSDTMMMLQEFNESEG